jgi:hypothetical protein
MLLHSDFGNTTGQNHMKLECFIFSQMLMISFACGKSENASTDWKKWNVMSVCYYVVCNCA